MTSETEKELLLRVAERLGQETPFSRKSISMTHEEARTISRVLREEAEGWRPIETATAWRDLCEKNDRTSPAEYPDHALITREELNAYMRGAAIAPKVKALEFPPRCPRGQRVHSRPQALIRYTIAHHGGDVGSTVYQWASEGGNWSEPHHTYEAAIWCAQADYEQRVSAALYFPPPPATETTNSQEPRHD